MSYNHRLTVFGIVFKYIAIERGKFKYLFWLFMSNHKQQLFDFIRGHFGGTWINFYYHSVKGNFEFIFCRPMAVFVDDFLFENRPQKSCDEVLEVKQNGTKQIKIFILQNKLKLKIIQKNFHLIIPQSPTYFQKTSMQST